MTLTIANMTSATYESNENEQDAPNILKIFWGVLMGAIAFALLISGGLKALQTADVVYGLPILVLALVMCVSYIKCMKSAKDYDIVGTFDSNKTEDMGKVENEERELEILK